MSRAMSRNIRRLLALGALAATGALFAVSNHESEILAWRADRVKTLTADSGWLSLAGLFWLHEGANQFGSDPASEIKLTDGPAHAGAVEFHKGVVTYQGKEIKPDVSEPIKVGRVSMYVIKRSDKYGIRVKDPETPERRGFHGFQYFPISDEYRFTAKWVAQPKSIPILNVIGQTEPSPNPGYAVFQLRGHEYRLYPILETLDAQQLFYIFRDQTSGVETYGAGRFFYSDMPHDGKVVIDFNKAYNPPCAFTPYATCPLPPRENRLAVRIEAGEKKYGDH
jgi:uncharacterized protein (DUF1684 family)